jgi:photosystem II stability/assembly factor-like uncharacterized protein
MRFPACPVLLKALIPAALLVSSAPLSAAVPGSWKSIGPPGGSVYALVYAPSRPQTMYAGVDGGVYRTTNGGAAWTFAGAGLTGIDLVGSLAVSPADPSTVYAVEDSGRLSKSLDGGASWTPTASFRVSRVVTPAKGSGTVYAVNYQGLYRSTNGGATWKKLTAGLPIPYRPIFLVADPVDPNRLYAEVVVDPGTSETRLYTTTDGGASWKPAGSRGLPAAAEITGLAIDPQLPNILYAGISTGDRIYKSRDRGASWLPGGEAPQPVAALQVDPSRSNVIFAGAIPGLARSEDGGRTWTNVSQSLPFSARVLAFAFPPTKARTLFLAAATYNTGFQRGGVFASVNGGGDWTLRSTGLSTLGVTSIAVSPGVLWVAADDGLFKSEDQGATWPRVQVDSDGNLVSGVAVDPTDPDDVYAVDDLEGLLRSRDGGQSWVQAGTSPGNLPIRLKFDPHTPSTLYAATGDNGDFDSLTKSTDGGATWTKLLSDLVSDFVISPSSPSTLYETGVLNGQPQIRRSTDGGATWTSIRAGLPDGPFTAVAVDPRAPDTVYTVASGQVFRSTDGGATWASLGTPVPGGNLQSLLFPVGAAAPYVAVDRDTVYQLADGDTWAPLGRMTPPRYPLFSLLAADPRDPCRLYAGTVDRGVLVFTSSGPGCS